MKYWKRIDKDGKVLTVESYSHNDDVKGAVEITEKEFSTVIALLPKAEPIPSRDLAKEIDEIKIKLASL